MQNHSSIHRTSFETFGVEDLHVWCGTMFHVKILKNQNFAEISPLLAQIDVKISKSVLLTQLAPTDEK